MSQQISCEQENEIYLSYTILARKVVAVRIQDLTFLVVNVYGTDLHKERRFLRALSIAIGKSILGKT